MLLPQTLGRLRQVRPLGSGGFAEVWLYHDPDLDSPVAVKALNPAWGAHAEIRERFLQEARFLRSVDSPHVLRVHDIGTTPDDLPYFVMSYADGGSVADLIAASPGGCAAVEVADVIGQAAEGLAALHARGVIHRDVKPANLLLTRGPDGVRRVMVGDLGIARALDTRTEVTRNIGTPAYMAPEQFDTTLPVDHRADVRGLGAVAWAMLSGRTPKPALTLASRVEPLGGAAPVPPDVARTVMRALEPDPAHRWPDARSFAAALGDAAQGRPVVLPHVPAPGPPGTAPPTMLPPAATTSPTAAPAATLPPPAPPHAPPASDHRSGPSPRRRGLLVGAAIAATIVVTVGGTVAVMQLSGDSGDGGGGTTVHGAEVAAVRFAEALQAEDCADAALYVPGVDPATWDCTGAGDDGFYFNLLQDLDVDGERRVEDLGDELFRVVWVDQGYINMQRKESSTFEVQMVVCC